MRPFLCFAADTFWILCRSRTGWRLDMDLPVFMMSLCCRYFFVAYPFILFRSRSIESGPLNRRRWRLPLVELGPLVRSARPAMLVHQTCIFPRNAEIFRFRVTLQFASLIVYFGRIVANHFDLSHSYNSVRLPKLKKRVPKRRCYYVRCTRRMRDTWQEQQSMPLQRISWT